MIIIKIITLFMTIYAVDTRSSVSKLVIEDETPTQMFQGNVYPMTYSHGTGDQPSTPSTIVQPESLIPNYNKMMQYAPLQGRINQKTKNTAAEYTKVKPTLSIASEIPTESWFYSRDRVTKSNAKAHLEPRVPTGEPPQDPVKCYSQEHSAESLSPVSRSPGHNAIYRNYQDSPKPKTFKFNQYIPAPPVPPVVPHVDYENLEPIVTTIPPFELPSENIIRPFKMANHNFVLNPHNMVPETVLPKTKRQFSPYAKYHRLHLNIARVYSPGQVPPQPPNFPSPYNFARLQVHSQNSLNQKTLLYPVKNKQNYRFRLP